MSFFDYRLDPCYSLGAKGGPMFSTDVSKTVGGFRYANSNWAYPLHRYDVTQGVKTFSDFDEVRAFFYNVKGRADGFRFKDWMDYRAAGQPALFVPGSTTVLQLFRRYAAGPRTYDRPVFKPVQAAGLVLMRNGSPISKTVDWATGRVTIAGHVSGNAYTWTGEFDVPVAFTTDVMEAEVVDKGRDGGLFQRWGPIVVEEFRL